VVKRGLALVGFGFLMGAALAAFLTFPRGWNLLMGAAAATFAAIVLGLTWGRDAEPDGPSGETRHDR